MTIAATYINTNTFTVTDNQTGEFHTGRRVKLIGSTNWFGTIESSVYSSVTTISLTAASDNIDSSLTEVYYGIVSAKEDDSSMPIHDHDGDEGSGGEIDHTTLTNIGTNTHAQIDSTLSTNSDDISTNTGDILNNTNSIAVVSGTVDSNTSDISTNVDAIALNTTHRTSNGTDHSYINQDVTSTGSPTFNKTQLTPQTTPSWNEGLVFYDNDKKALSYFNDESDVIVNTGQEVLIPVYNDSGDAITNGQIVYPSGVDATSGLPTIDLADAHIKSKCRLIGMVTHTIENETTGYVTRIGSVSDVNTEGLSGILYLSATVLGGYTMTQPDDGAYITAIGAVGKAHISEGTIIVDPTISNLTVEITDQNGFPSDQRTGTTLSFSNSSPDRTFTITPTGAGFHFYQLGDKYEKIGAQSIQLDNTEGLHVIYYDGEILTSVANPSSGQVSLIIMYKAIVAYIYWDTTNLTYSYFADERHGISMSPETHNYLHFTRGAQYLSGLGLSNIVADGSTSLDTSTQFGIASGYTTDEDIMTIFSTIGSTIGLPIYYLDGVNGHTRRTINSGYSVTGAVAGLLYYNEWTGSIWQLTECSSGNFVLYHVFAVNGLTGEDQQVVVVGQNEYTIIADARAAASTEITAILSGFPFEEVVPIGTIIFETKSSFTNTMKARVRTTDAGEDYVDWRTTELAQGATPSDHNNLTNLQLASTTVTWGHINDNAQTLYGVKTFDYFPVTSSGAPTTDYQVANKKYVDDNAGASPLTTKGDIYTYDTDNTRLGIGTEGQVLTVASGEATGLKWAAGLSDIVDDTTPQLGGDLDLNNHSINYGSILTSNGTYTGEYIINTIDDSSTVFGDVLYQASDFHFERALAGDDSTCPAVVIALESGSGSKKVMIRGQVCNTSWNWNSGKVYTSTTSSGGLTQTAASGTGEIIQIVGYALSADTIWFDSNIMLIEVT